jgi:hypothetical protein
MIPLASAALIGELERRYVVIDTYPLTFDVVLIE